MQPLPVLAILLFHLTVGLVVAESSISRNGDAIVLEAGIVRKVLRISEGNIRPDPMTVAGREVVSGQST